MDVDCKIKRRFKNDFRIWSDIFFMEDRGAKFSFVYKFEKFEIHIRHSHGER